MDDTLCGANNKADVQNQQQQLIALLGRGGLLLRTFNAYHPKTQGLLWNPSPDQFLIIKGTCIQKLRGFKKSSVIKRDISLLLQLFLTHWA